VLGGVPTPVPELADLLARARLACFFAKLLAWAPSKDVPGFMFCGTSFGVSPRIIVPQPEHRRPRHGSCPTLYGGTAPLSRTGPKVPVVGPLPSFQENLKAIDATAQHLACTCLVLDPCTRSVTRFRSNTP